MEGFFQRTRHVKGNFKGKSFVLKATYGHNVLGMFYEIEVLDRKLVLISNPKKISGVRRDVLFMKHGISLNEYNMPSLDG